MFKTFLRWAFNRGSLVFLWIAAFLQAGLAVWNGLFVCLWVTDFTVFGHKILDAYLGELLYFPTLFTTVLYLCALSLRLTWEVFEKPTEYKGLWHIRAGAGPVAVCLWGFLYVGWWSVSDHSNILCIPPRLEFTLIASAILTVLAVIIRRFAHVSTKERAGEFVQLTDGQIGQDNRPNLESANERELGRFPPLDESTRQPRMDGELNPIQGELGSANTGPKGGNGQSPAQVVSSQAKSSEPDGFEARVLEFLRGRGEVPAGVLRQEMGLPRSTLKLKLGRLVAQGRIVRIGKARNTAFRARSAPEAFREGKI